MKVKSYCHTCKICKQSKNLYKKHDLSFVTVNGGFSYPFDSLNNFLGTSFLQGKQGELLLTKYTISIR